MKRQDKLQLQYEDAVFALLVDDAARAEGEELLALNERLKADPGAAVPEELDKRCREIIRDALRKEQAKSRNRSLKKTLKVLLTAALIAAMLFTVAYAAVPEFQVAVKNLVLTITETDAYTSLGLKPLEPVPAKFEEVFRYSLPSIPDGYVLVDEYTIEDPGFRGYWYNAPDGNHYTIDIAWGNETSSMAIDTENAQSVTDIVINGYLGLCVLKNGTVQIAWVDTDRSVFLGIYATNLPKKQVKEMAEAIRYVEANEG